MPVAINLFNNNDLCYCIGLPKLVKSIEEKIGKNLAVRCIGRGR